MASAAAAAPASDLAPNQTLYVNNLNEKVKRGELKKTLYANFSQFGRVMQIICKGSFRLKGQAWVVFDEITAAARAKRQLHNVPILGKPLVRRNGAGRLRTPGPGRGAYVPGRRSVRRPRCPLASGRVAPGPGRPCPPRLLFACA